LVLVDVKLQEEVKEKVPWAEFAKALIAYINYEEDYEGSANNDIKWKALRMLMGR